MKLGTICYELIDCNTPSEPCTLLAHYKANCYLSDLPHLQVDYPNVIDVKNFESLNIIAIKMKIINHNISSIKMFLMPIKMSMISKPVICGSLKRCFWLLQRDDKDEDDD